MNDNTVTVGLIAGRHPLPVSKYIFEKEIEDVMNFDEIAEKIYEFLKGNVGISVYTGFGINQAWGCDEEIFHSDIPLVVYVTGLTPVTAELIRLCALNGVQLTLMHYNSATGNYVPQIIFP